MKRNHDAVEQGCDSLAIALRSDAHSHCTPGVYWWATCLLSAFYWAK